MNQEVATRYLSQSHVVEELSKIVSTILLFSEHIGGQSSFYLSNLELDHRVQSSSML